MTSAEMTSTILRAISAKGEDEKNGKKDVPVFRYLDLDSTFRNRNQYPNPNDFVVPMLYPGRNGLSSTAIDPVSLAIPYHSPLDPTLIPPIATTPYVTALPSFVGTNVYLDVRETIIDNFYVNSYLEVSGEFRKILSYTNANKLAVIESAFLAFPGGVPAATAYLTRRAIPNFVGAVTAVVSNQEFNIGPNASTSVTTYASSFVRFTSGANIGLTRQISSYSGAPNFTIITTTPFPNAVVFADTLEIDGYSYDSSNPMTFSGNPNAQVPYFEMELLWLSLPKQVLNTSYGGLFENYPYVYLNIFNEGKPHSSQLLYSNNPTSTRAVFKVPIDQYYGNTSFYTLKDIRMRQVMKFLPSQDIRFQIQLPDGSIAGFATPDYLSPQAPNPFLQVSALFSLRKLSFNSTSTSS